MNTTKSWWQSRTIWGILAAAAGTILTNLGISVNPPAPNADYSVLAGYANQVQAAHGNWQVIAGIALAAIGTLVGIYGRVKADTSIVPSAPPKTN